MGRRGEGRCVADARGRRARTRSHRGRRPLCRVVDRRHGSSFSRAPRHRPRTSRWYRLAGRRGPCSSRTSLPLDRGWPIPVDRTLALPAPRRHPGLSDLSGHVRILQRFHIGLSSPAGTLASAMARNSRIDAARARARGAKTAIAGLTALVFGVAFVGAKAYAPGHTKGRAKPLGAPSSFERAVRRSALQGGQLAPPVQPPAVATASS